MMYKGIEIGITEYGTHFIKDKAGNIRLFKKEKYVKQYIDRYCTDGYIDSKKLKVMIMSDWYWVIKIKYKLLFTGYEKIKKISYIILIL